MNIVDIAQFYTQPLGKTTQELLAAKLQVPLQVQPDQLVAGLGFASPYLNGDSRSVSFMMARAGVIHWPIVGTVRSALVDELDLPLSDNSVDVALLVHALEFAESAEDLLQEVWRVLTPQGKLILVVPNRRGLWSSSDATPFGQGQPFSRSQLSALLKDAQFVISNMQQALVGPPWGSAGLAKILEPASRFGFGRLSGAILVEATKQVYAYSTGKLVRRALPRIRPMLLPRPQPAARV